MTRLDSDEILRELRSIEEELAGRLGATLSCVDGNAQIFSPSERDLHGLPERVPSSAASVLLALSRRALELRRQLALPSEGTPGLLYLNACDLGADLSNERCLGPRRIAERPLAQLPAPADRSRWSVWRRDENGNVFEVSHGHTRDEAQRLVEEFESRGHKQHYWAELETRPPSERSS